ncbi:MAG: hypothetical protein IPP17_30330 [Bacteroidetes bacterium]|nr:hypothetical protein [Bacteroidota bacterium]
MMHKNDNKVVRTNVPAATYTFSFKHCCGSLKNVKEVFAGARITPEGLLDFNILKTKNMVNANTTGILEDAMDMALVHLVIK